MRLKNPDAYFRSGYKAPSFVSGLYKSASIIVVFSGIWLITITLLTSQAFADGTSNASADPLALQEQEEAFINKAADGICSAVQESGSSESNAVKGTVDVQIHGFVKKVVDAGGSVSGDVEDEGYQNVLRADLGKTIQDIVACRLTVFESLRPEIIQPIGTSPPAVNPVLAAQPPVSPNDNIPRPPAGQLAGSVSAMSQAKPPQTAQAPTPQSETSAFLIDQGKSAYSKSNYVDAMKYYRQAADQGNSQAQNYVGILFQTGRGVTRDYGQALLWYQKAADQGNDRAAWNIGCLYLHGNGVQTNEGQARSWITKAAAEGYYLAKEWIQSTDYVPSPPTPPGEINGGYFIPAWPPACVPEPQP